ncbi:DUF1905 domain-containing protein [Brachybacterium huguangmaarense]
MGPRARWFRGGRWCRGVRWVRRGRGLTVNLAFTTTLFPREGRHLVPVKVAVQRAEGIDVSDEVRVELEIDDRGR